MSGSVSICRCLIGKKPRRLEPPTAIFRCESCGGFIFSENEGGDHSCCGAEMKKENPRPATELPEGMVLDYDIVGGLDQNCVRVFFSGEKPKLLLLDTFSGFTIKRLNDKSRSPVIFPLAGEDAYAYCDKNPCEMCSFRCKYGFELFAYYEKHGLFVLPLNRIAATQGSSENRTNTPPHNQ